MTPGGRFSKDVDGIRDMAEELAKGGYSVLIYDRPNCGASDVCFSGISESHQNADTLAGLIRGLGWGPSLLVGGSGGARETLLAAIHLGGSLLLASRAMDAGVQLLRVHDVAETVQARDVWRGLRDAALTDFSQLV